MKARLRATCIVFITKISFHLFENKTSFHMKSLALSLAFITRLKQLGNGLILMACQQIFNGCSISSFLQKPSLASAVRLKPPFHRVYLRFLCLFPGLSYGDEQRHMFDRKKVVGLCEKVTRITEEALGKRSELHGQLVQWFK